MPQTTTFYDCTFTSNNTATTTTTTIYYPNWVYTNAATTSSNIFVGNNAIWQAPMSQAELEAWKEAEVKRKAELAAAEKIAEGLLLDLIGRRRYQIWRTKGCVHVSSRKYKNLRYEIKAGEMIRLHERRDMAWRVRKDQLCVHPRDKHPRGDEVAALYVLARFDEDALWVTANRHGADQELMPVAA
jgi:hypothetical protein